MENSSEVPKETVPVNRRLLLKTLVGTALVGLVGRSREKPAKIPEPIFLEPGRPAFLLVDKEAAGGGTAEPVPEPPKAVPAAPDPSSARSRFLEEQKKRKEKLEALPTDVFSEAELRKLNIHIHRTKDIGLLLQRSALKHDPLVQYAKKIGDRYASQSDIVPKFRLDVVLLDQERMREEADELPEEIRWLKNSYEKYAKNDGNSNSETAGMLMPYRYKLPTEIPGTEIIDRQTNQQVKDAVREGIVIFLCVGGSRKPLKVYSAISPSMIVPFVSLEQAKDEQYWKNLGVNSYIPSTKTTGEALRHEWIGHFDPNNLVSFDEMKADIKSISSLVEAYNLWQINGDLSKYYFVFTTPEGPVYTKSESETQNLRQTA
ncbi:MAG: hypothetical protein HY376_00815 [Candidatus Blackburnbacteria bacterium]|nr:hypothetical protein [Candidatus Blackburnbacteria bacterium]